MKKTTLFLLCILFSLGISAQTPFYFIQLTDPQFGMIDKNASFDKETALMEKAVKQINKLNPGFVVVTGDLVNEGNNADQIKEFKRILATLRKDIPVYLTPGNHDVGQQPTCYNQIRGQHGHRYADLTQEPAFAFGEGLSYTRVEYRDLTLEEDVLGFEATLRATVTVENVGDRGAA